MKAFFFILLICACNSLFAATTYQLDGKIGNYKISMTFTDYTDDYPDDDSNTVLGQYFYHSSLKDITFSGYRENRTFILSVESWENDTLETITLKKEGDNFSGSWKNKKGKSLPITLSPIDISNYPNQYDNTPFVLKLKESNPIDYVRTSLFKFERDTVTTDEGKSFVWFNEKHCLAPFFRLGNGFNKEQLSIVNPVLDDTHLMFVQGQLTCNSQRSHSDGKGIDYSTTINYISNDLIGFQVFASWDCGGAHPDFAGQGCLIDLHSAKMYDLPDIYTFTTQQLYDVLNEAHNLDASKGEDCDYSELEYWEYASWSVTQDGMEFTPSFYRAARSCEESFPLPFSWLSKFKNKDFPYDL